MKREKNSMDEELNVCGKPYCILRLPVHGKESAITIREERIMAEEYAGGAGQVQK